MKHKLFKCGRLGGMLLGAAALLAMVPLMSVPALAEDVAVYDTPSIPVSNENGMNFATVQGYWKYVNENGDFKYFGPDDVNRNITARDWKWYGFEGDGDIPRYTLEILNDFDLYTTDDYAIKLPAGSTVIFRADVKLEAKENCIYSDGKITLKGEGEMTDRTTLTFGSAGIRSDALNVTIENLNLNTDPDSVDSSDYAIFAYKNLRLQDCYFYAGDAWAGKNVVNCETYNLSRGVDIDILGSYFTSRSGYGNYIANVAYVSNVLYDQKYELKVGESYENDTNSLSPADESERMLLITNTFWTADYDINLYEKAMSEPDRDFYQTLGGKTYSIELSDLMSVNIDEYDYYFDSDSVYLTQYALNFDHDTVNDLWYLNVTVPNQTLDQIDIDVCFGDIKREFGTGETKKLHLVIGKTLKTHKLEIVNPSFMDTDNLLNHVDMSLKFNDDELSYIQDSGIYYLIPQGYEFKLSLLPKNCVLSEVFYGDSVTDCEPIGPSVDAIYPIFLESDKGVYIWYSESDEKQYSTLSVSDELISAAKAGKINSVIAYDDVSGKTWSLAKVMNDFPTSFLTGRSVQITISAEDYGVSDICGKAPRYNSEQGIHFYKLDYLTVNGDTVITAPVRELCKFTAFSINGPHLIIKGDRDPSGMGYLGVEYTITAPFEEGKLLVGADFDGTPIEPYSADDNGWNYKVTTISGAENKFVFEYTDVATLRIPKPEHGKVEFIGNLDGGRGVDTLADGTSVYTLATYDSVTLKFVPDDGYKFVSAAKDGKSMSWNDIGNNLGKRPENSSVKISLNGETTVPANVISAIKDRKLTVEFVYDSVKSWVVRGGKIGTVSAAELAAFPGSADSSALRGVFGVDLKVGGTKIPAELKLYFRDIFAGQFANVYKLNGGVLEFQRCVKVGADGSVTVPGADAAGEYVVMVCEFSDLPGDADNDGALSALDASAILKEAVGMAKSANAAVCDFNGDGEVNALDAAEVLKAVVGVR